MVKVNVPAALGVPLKVSVCGKPDAESESPEGGVPLVTLKATGAMPPLLEMLEA